jgi:hypothetical protein
MKARFIMGRGMDDVTVPDRDARWDKYVQRFEFGDEEFHPVRLFGDVVIDFVHNVKTKNGKIYREYCHGFDVDAGEFYENKKERCPCCKLDIKGSYRYLMNLIDLEAEENMPAKPKANWTPIRYIDISTSLFRRLKELKSVNKGYAISHPEKGAVVMIKYDPNADAANQYAGSMDTKNVPITEAQQKYTVTQKYPDGASQIVKGLEGLPAQYEYIRCINSRDDMVKSLRRHGYLGEADNGTAEHSFDKEEESMTRKQKVAKIDAETPVETVDLDLSTVFAPDEEPTPKTTSKATTPVAEEKPAVKEAPKENVKLEPCEECPTAFGQIANSLECFTKCAVMDQCREASSFATPPNKKTEAIVDDDDMV